MVVVTVKTCTACGTKLGNSPECGHCGEECHPRCPICGDWLGAACYECAIGLIDKIAELTGIPARFLKRAQ